MVWVKPGYSQAPFMPHSGFLGTGGDGAGPSPDLFTAKCTRTGIKLCVNLSFGYEAPCEGLVCSRAGAKITETSHSGTCRCDKNSIRAEFEMVKKIFVFLAEMRSLLYSLSARIVRPPAPGNAHS